MTGEVWRGGEKERENLLAEARRNGWASMHGGVVHVCARVASYARDEQREADDAIPAGGWMDGGGWVANVRVVGEGLNSLYYTP